MEERNMKRIIGIAISAVMLSAFATSAIAKKPPVVHPYEAAADMNSAGWLTAPADNGRYYVAYTGSKGMTRQQVAEYALLRAAEFTAESGQEWFAVIETKTQKVALSNKDDLRSRSGAIIGGPGGASAGSAGGQAASPRGTSDASTAGGASTGGFGGGAPPTAVTERWVPPQVTQTVYMIQMGKGEKAEFAGVKKTPEIFSAKTTAEEIRAKMKQ
jgi:hypothetical protein